ncbi:hypothetical protein SAMN06265348_1305 [Pedobacter westerhofensis]|uniref:Uncharacterized protein n=1 Tax=Pedobacter westerhofensis TaxID=425512 RepID=A0A521FUT5_9SPHI|nr:hypothetical protein [Pedobacter westerhofensis]SMO99938.1 hypothetical protein SAMN06265348_1305 [Pedobacter westerhofensis]
MARIRTVKPSFLRHELLQDLEAENPGKYIMMVFMGLWMLSDNKGRFEYKPRSMKLDILPFLEYSMQDTLNILEESGFIRTYLVDGQKYGSIPSFKEHQRITGKEATEGEKYPPEPFLIPDDQQGNSGESIGKQPGAQEGKGKEEEGNKEGKGEVGSFPHSEINMVLLTEVLKFFQFNEIANPDKQREVGSFLKCLTINNRQKYFEEQFVAYVEYKKINDSFPHSFKKFIGSHSDLFEDGAWNAENWVEKLNTERLRHESKKIKGKAESIIDLHSASIEYWKRVEELENKNKGL